MPGDFTDFGSITLATALMALSWRGEEPLSLQTNAEEWTYWLWLSISVSTHKDLMGSRACVCASVMSR